MATVVKGGCPHDCPDTCAWQVTVEAGRAVKMAGDPKHPITRGALCAKVNNYLDRVYSPDRVLHALRRTGPKGEGHFERVPLDEALADIAHRLHKVIAAHGPEAVLPYSYAGNMGLIQYRGMDRRFFNRLGASRLARTICGDTANAGVEAVLGTPMGLLPADIEHARLILIWGSNTLVTNLHLWPFVRRARERGARLIVIDPLRTRTAGEADWHLQPLPGTDAALALGMMHVIVREGLQDQAYLDAHAGGFDELRRRLPEYPPERVAQICGLAPADIERLAREYATTRPSCIRTLVGPEKHAAGAASFRAIASLPALVGAWRDRGGGLLHWTRALFDESLNTRSLGSRSPRSRIISMIQIGRALTDPDLDPPVKALFVYNSNPAVIAPNQNLVLQGLRREDLFTVVHDLFVTDTARHADFVLPAASFIEQWDLLFPWGHEYLVLNRPAVPPPGEAVTNTELFRRLAAAMGYQDPMFAETDEQMMRGVLDSEHPYVVGVTFERLLAEGWARLNLPEARLPFAEGDFPTPDGRCRLMSDGFTAPPVDGYPLVMVSAKSLLHFLNSSYSHLPRHARAEGEPGVDLDPADAATRGIADGDAVRVFNDRGELLLAARVGKRVRQGVVSIPHGRWGAGANALTSDGLSDLGGGGDFYGTRVEVEKL